jgi:hypothetical protein
MTYTGLYIMENSLVPPGKETSNGADALASTSLFDVLMAYVGDVANGVAAPAL